MRGCKKKIHRWLNAHGYKAGEEDGIFGDKTRTSVIEFQSGEIIVVNGIASSRT
ncbi:MAG: peptidoglycan-binding domain-containing protein [Methanobacterium sp.]|nr:peptidoglycan-binding domain-containing protein [Methanobacterium sp.]